MNKVLVIHVNAFTRKISDGYVARKVNGKIGKKEQSLTKKEMAQYLLDNSEIPVEFCYV